jgi:hypothetical protein
MRARKRPNSKRSKLSKLDIILAVANHGAMGVALGLAFALILTWSPFFRVRDLINTDPRMTMAGFVGTVVLMFGIGAALTGVILMMEEA